MGGPGEDGGRRGPREDRRRDQQPGPRLWLRIASTPDAAHTPALAATARDLLIGLGLQRAPVRSLALRTERLRPAEDTVDQLTLAALDNQLRRLETALGRAATRFGSGVAGAASTFPGTGRPDHVGNAAQWTSASSRLSPIRLVAGATE